MLKLSGLQETHHCVCSFNIRKNMTGQQTVPTEPWEYFPSKISVQVYTHTANIAAKKLLSPFGSLPESRFSVLFIHTNKSSM